MLDLNVPSDARAYLRSWAENGAHVGAELAPDEDVLRVAIQLFMYCDPRPPLNMPGVLH